MSRTDLLTDIIPSIRCSARSKQTGRQCGAWAIPGGTVCYHHGGAARQVKAAATERIRARLMALAGPAVVALEELVAKATADDGTPASVRLAAARDILDRAGYGATQKVEIDATHSIRSEIDAELSRLAEELAAQDRARGASATGPDRLTGSVETGSPS